MNANHRDMVQSYNLRFFFSFSGRSETNALGANMCIDCPGYISAELQSEASALSPLRSSKAATNPADQSCEGLKAESIASVIVSIGPRAVLVTNSQLLTLPQELAVSFLQAPWLVHLCSLLRPKSLSILKDMWLNVAQNKI